MVYLQGGDDDEDDEEDYMEYESGEGGQALNTGNLMTPYKGSMIGGTIIGEESVIPGNMPEHLTKLKNRNYFIYFSEIDKIIHYQNTVIIVKKNQEIDKLLLRSEERAKDFLKILQKSFMANFKSSITI